MKNLEELAAALDSHQVTDESGEVGSEETLQEDTATFEEKTPVEESAMAEKSEEPEEVATKATDEGDENDVLDASELAEDETGNKYIPEKRFKDIYGKWKAAERKLKESGNRTQLEDSTSNVQPATPQPTDRTEALEVEMLFTKMPEFDPNSGQYQRALDRLGAKILKANPGITRLQAAREAIAMAKELASATASEIAQARSVKASQADQGITNRVVSRQASAPDVNSMTLEEKEAYLKSIGQW